jgi:hypothetical protein
VPDVETLAARIDDQYQRRELAVPKTLGGASETTSTDAAFAPSSLDAGNGAARTECEVTARRLATVTESAVLEGTASLAGSPVTVHLYVRGAERVLVVLDLQCRLVNLRVLAA